MPSESDRIIATRARMAGLVIAVTMVLWLAGQWIGPRMGLPPRYVFLFDFAALAGFFWALVVVFQIWRLRRADGK